MGLKRILSTIVVFITLILLTPLLAQGPEEETLQPYSQPLVRIGVLAYRPKLQTLQQWRPLADLLKDKLPNYDFVIEALTYSEMSEAIAQKELDFILTNSGHYIFLKHRFSLSSPLATLAVEENGIKTTSFGGVIFTRSDNTSINTLQDLKGKRIAAVNKVSLGGYQMQTYELLKNNIHFPHDMTLSLTGLPHDNVVQKVLSHQVDVGFVRTGVLEKMAQENLISLNDFKIIQAPNTPIFPVRLSTSLYPEWPFSALTHVNENLARKVVSILFRVEENQTTMKTMQIYGFNIPSNYLALEEMLRTMRLPPFDEKPLLNLWDIWDNYRIFIIIFSNILLFLLGYVLFSLWRKNRQLQESQFLYTKLSEHTNT
ncbi:MAG: phosphate/phosphite/phosphonate ABC transporter substrate-binding protein, partial [Sulfurospirillaceae bacterium]|nr:phosphate/phosphite/phosphonate ABC transporter substrate-binding protein [Sulfurospirillaceae bacterium]